MKLADDVRRSAGMRSNGGSIEYHVSTLDIY